MSNLETFTYSEQFVQSNTELLKPGGAGHSLLTGLHTESPLSPEKKGFPELRLNDGTFLSWDSIELRQEILSCEPGTRFSFLEVPSRIDLGKVKNSNPILMSLMSRETLAIYHPEIRNGQFFPHFRLEKPSNDQNGWGQVNLDEIYPEKALAVGILAETYHQEKGFEGEAILALILEESNVAQSTDSLNGLPCRVTHDGRPDYGSTKSLLARASVAGAQLRGLNLSNQELPPRWFRFRRDEQGEIVSLTDADLLGNHKPIERKTLQRLGLIQLASNVAKENPTHMGAGTSPLQIIDAVNEMAVQLPSRIQSGDPLQTSRDDLKNALKRVRS